jgi:transposase-like protein
MGDCVGLTSREVVYEDLQISTRSVDELVKAMGMGGISKSQVSRVCTEIDERVRAFLDLPIESDWPYLWIDATYVRSREAGRIVSKAVMGGVDHSPATTASVDIGQSPTGDD